MPELPDVATPFAEATVPPPFEQIVARARRRRRRNVLGVAAVTAAVLVAVATGTALRTGDQDTVPQPTRPSGIPTSTTTASEVDAARIILSGTLGSYAAGTGGSLLTVWTTCPDGGEQAGCHSAWQLQTAGDTFQGLAGGDNPVAYAAGDSFVVKSWNHEGILIDRHGHVRRIAALQHGTVSPGDVLVGHGKGLAVVNPAAAHWWPLPVLDGTEGWVQGAVSTAGTTWAMPFLSHGVWIAWSDGAVVGSVWHHHVMPADHNQDSLPGYLAVAGDHVAALSGYDGATVLPVADLAVTADGGRTWDDLHQTNLPFQYVDAMAATSGGTLYVVTPGGEHLYRSTDATWTRFAEVPNPQRADNLVAAGDHVLARGGTATQPVLFALDDTGRSTPVDLLR